MPGATVPRMPIVTLRDGLREKENLLMAELGQIRASIRVLDIALGEGVIELPDELQTRGKGEMHVDTPKRTSAKTISECREVILRNLSGGLVLHTNNIALLLRDHFGDSVEIKETSLRSVLSRMTSEGVLERVQQGEYRLK